MPYEKFDNTWVSVTVEMNLSLITYERNVFTLFDMLSDIGGLSGILMTLFSVLAAIWNLKNFKNMMVSALFKVTKTQNEMKKDQHYRESPLDISERS